MKKEKQKIKGFSLIETILTVVLLSLLIGFGLYYSQSTNIRTDINSQTKFLAANLRLAQSNAATGKINEPNAIHLESNSYTMFVGTSYSPTDPQNYTETLPETMTIANIALNGGGSDIIFATPNGETSTYGSFNITSAEINKTIQITINKLGSINY